MLRSETPLFSQKRLGGRWDSDTYNRRGYGWMNRLTKNEFMDPELPCEIRKGAN